LDLPETARVVDFYPVDDEDRDPEFVNPVHAIDDPVREGSKTKFNVILKSASGFEFEIYIQDLPEYEAGNAAENLIKRVFRDAALPASGYAIEYFLPPYVQIQDISFAVYDEDSFEDEE